MKKKSLIILLSTLGGITIAGVIGGVVTYKIVNKVDKSKPPVLVKQLKKAIYNDDKTECLEIGYFKNSHGEIQIEKFPETINKVPKELPKQITSLNRAFHLNLNSQITNLDNWNTSNITNMEWMFTGAEMFNQDISKWDVSKVTNMNSMFTNAKKFNQDISMWNTSNVIKMDHMFSFAASFNQDISKWTTDNVTNMSFMFYGASSFNQDISKWTTDNVTNMSFMFYGASSFNKDI
ncbi:BspA family leucine-rich repeat surface protein [Mycoplasma capricolum subsp. capricolum]|uniref:BspA family leucine-rich repeat surface protein n=1 Tax=Mycoplasma capricolum TaxID=2095 RepID=UPI0020C18063|nr:BspA family leucine-rich repeat surface protein [Mycoplasma capricolum]MCK8462216.1 BspA family leucine-rich repeat surface protein [Mycoplasma capricolum subsp. capricolum]